VGSVGSTSSSLAFGRSAPALGDARVCNMCQLRAWKLRDDGKLTSGECGNDSAIHVNGLVIFLGGVVVLVWKGVS
jgi:hypothetical protein